MGKGMDRATSGVLYQAIVQDLAKALVKKFGSDEFFVTIDLIKRMDCQENKAVLMTNIQLEMMKDKNARQALL